MAIVTGDRYLDFLVKFVEKQKSPLLEGSLVLKLNPVGLHYVQSRLEQLRELEGLLAGAPVDYLRAYISDLGDHRALEQLRKILWLLTSLKVVSVLPPPIRDPTPISLLPFGRLRVLELRGCDLSTSAARGLLELRHTLEKIICHNSTDALRHVFASRIVDIKDMPVWSKLSFVSCACNGLVLMDVSLQLLPVVETLDLSRNRFAKVDNLRKCTKLRHLDFGFNHLQSIASLSEVTSRIIKLVLRNNALTTLRGIENLKSVEGLDLSYNIISSFSELEILAGLSSLKRLWLEGNPVCCASWYRAQVFSLFTHSEKLQLDERGISKRESWKRQIILASRQKRPAAYGFYYPAKEGEEEGSFNIKRRKMSRLACIEDDEQGKYYASESIEGSVSCDSENPRREESAISDGEAEIVGLMNRVELMKKERSIFWLREFREWMDQNPEDSLNTTKFTSLISSPGKEKHLKNRKGHKHHGEGSRYESDSIDNLGDESDTNILESDISFTDTLSSFHVHEYFDSNSNCALEPTMMDGISESLPIQRMDKRPELVQANGSSREEHGILPLVGVSSFYPDTLTVEGGDRIDQKVSVSPLTAIDEIMESRSSSMQPGSPPHYQEDILHRRHNLEEEFMQLSAESYSVASSGTDTSSSDDDHHVLATSSPGGDQLLKEESLERSMDSHQDVLPSEESYYDRSHEEQQARKCSSSLDSCSEQASSMVKLIRNDHAKPLCSDVLPSSGITSKTMDEDVGCSETRKSQRRSRRRVVSLWGEDSVERNVDTQSPKSNGMLRIGKHDIIHGVWQSIQLENGLHQSYDADKQQEKMNEVNNLLICDDESSVLKSKSCSSTFQTDRFIENYFNENIADVSISETCLQHMRCSCMRQQGSGCHVMEVVVLLSSENKLYMLNVDTASDGTGNIVRVFGCLQVQDIKEIVIGIGMQVLRVHIEGDVPCLFITGSLKKSRGLLCLLQVCDSSETRNRCSLRSWEQVQFELFEKHVCGGNKISIFLYSMTLFWCKGSDENAWVSRSLFVIEGYVLVCMEDLAHFSSPTDNTGKCSPYFSLQSCCPILSISEMVIASRASRLLILKLDHARSKNVCILPNLKKQCKEKFTKSITWKLRWFSEDTLLKFVSVVKAIHAGWTTSPLPVRCIS